MSIKRSIVLIVGMVCIILLGAITGAVLFFVKSITNDTGVVTGTVTDVMGTSLSQQVIQLTSDTDRYTSITNEAGEFTIHNVQVGSYSVEATNETASEETAGGENEIAQTDIIVSKAGATTELVMPILKTDFDFMPPADESTIVTRSDGTQAIAGEIIVRWSETVTENQRNTIAEAYGLTLLADTPEIYLSVFATTDTVDEVTTQLNQDANVVLATPSYVLNENLIPYDPDYLKPANNWWLTQVNAEPAWEINLGRSIIVGVVDAGFDFKHPDLRSAFTSARVNYTTSPINESNDHGTHVSGIIAMQLNNAQGMVGIAPRTRILPAKTKSMARVADAFRFYAKCPTVKVISISMGNNWWSMNDWRKQHGLADLTLAEKQKISSDIDTILEPAVTLLTQNNKLIVHSAGNDAGDATLNTLNFDQVVTVAATDKSDNLAVFSNSGAQVDIAAPGTDIYSAVTGSYGFQSGTSMATPLVAGIAALVRAERPALTAAQVKEILEDTAEPSSGLAVHTFGRVDAWRALLKASKQMGVEGTVYDAESNQVVPKADVTDNRSTGVTANMEGFYRIPALPWARVTLRGFADDKEDEQMVETPDLDVVVTGVDFYLETEEEEETNENSNENSNENDATNEDDAIDDDVDNVNDTDDETSNTNSDGSDSTDEHTLLDNGVVVSRAGCGVGGYPLPAAEGDCPDGFYFSRETIACEQIQCPDEAGRTYTLECKCPENTTAIYACDIPGYVVACVTSTP